MAGIIKRPPKPAANWTSQEWEVGIHMSGRYQRAVLVSVGPDPTQHVYLQRIGARRSPMAIMPGSSVIVHAGPEDAINLARSAGFAASLDSEQIEYWQQVI